MLKKRIISLFVVLLFVLSVFATAQEITLEEVSDESFSCNYYGGEWNSELNKCSLEDEEEVLIIEEDVSEEDCEGFFGSIGCFLWGSDEARAGKSWFDRTENIVGQAATSLVKGNKYVVCINTCYRGYWDGSNLVGSYNGKSGATADILNIEINKKEEYQAAFKSWSYYKGYTPISINKIGGYADTKIDAGSFDPKYKKTKEQIEPYLITDGDSKYLYLRDVKNIPEKDIKSWMNGGGDAEVYTPLTTDYVNTVKENRNLNKDDLKPLGDWCAADTTGCGKFTGCIGNSDSCVKEFLDSGSTTIRAVIQYQKEKGYSVDGKFSSVKGKITSSTSSSTIDAKSIRVPTEKYSQTDIDKSLEKEVIERIGKTNFETSLKSIDSKITDVQYTKDKDGNIIATVKNKGIVTIGDMKNTNGMNIVTVKKDYDPTKTNLAVKNLDKEFQNVKISELSSSETYLTNYNAPDLSKVSSKSKKAVVEADQQKHMDFFKTIEAGEKDAVKKQLIDTGVKEKYATCLVTGNCKDYKDGDDGKSTQAARSIMLKLKEDADKKKADLLKSQTYQKSIEISKLSDSEKEKLSQGNFDPGKVSSDDAYKYLAGYLGTTVDNLKSHKDFKDVKKVREALTKYQKIIKKDYEEKKSSLTWKVTAGHELLGEQDEALMKKGIIKINDENYYYCKDGAKCTNFNDFLIKNKGKTIYLAKDKTDIGDEDDSDIKIISSVNNEGLGELDITYKNAWTDDVQKVFFMDNKPYSYEKGEDDPITGKSTITFDASGKVLYVTDYDDNKVDAMYNTNGDEIGSKVEGGHVAYLGNNKWEVRNDKTGKRTTVSNVQDAYNFLQGQTITKTTEVDVKQVETTLTNDYNQKVKDYNTQLNKVDSEIKKIVEVSKYTVGKDEATTKIEQKDQINSIKSLPANGKESLKGYLIEKGYDEKEVNALINGDEKNYITGKSTKLTEEVRNLITKKKADYEFSMMEMEDEYKKGTYQNYDDFMKEKGHIINYQAGTTKSTIKAEQQMQIDAIKKLTPEQRDGLKQTLLSQGYSADYVNALVNGDSGTYVDGSAGGLTKYVRNMLTAKQLEYQDTAKYKQAFEVLKASPEASKEEINIVTKLLSGDYKFGVGETSSLNMASKVKLETLETLVKNKVIDDSGCASENRQSCLQLKLSEINNKKNKENSDKKKKCVDKADCKTLDGQMDYHKAQAEEWTAQKVAESVYVVLDSVKSYPALSKAIWGEDTWYKDWQQDLDQAFAPMLGSQWFPSAICESKARMNKIEPEGKAIIKTTSGTYQAVASVQVERSDKKSPILCTMNQDEEADQEWICDRGQVCVDNEFCYADVDEDGEADNDEILTGYFYKLTWGVKAPTDEKFTVFVEEGVQGVTFNVALYDYSGNVKYLYNRGGIIDDALILKTGENDADVVTKYSPNDYAQACILWGTGGGPKSMLNSGGSAAGQAIGGLTAGAGLGTAIGGAAAGTVAAGAVATGVGAGALVVGAGVIAASSGASKIGDVCFDTVVSNLGQVSWKDGGQTNSVTTASPGVSRNSNW